LVFDVKGKVRFARKVTIPKREFLGVSPEDAREIETLVTNFLGELLK
jgi:phage gpG-like protein